MLTSLCLMAAAAMAIDAEPTLPPAVAAFAAEANEWLLAGETLPPDYRLRVLAMSPADRVVTIIYLRRIGLLTEGAWSIDDLLRPQSEAKAAE